MLQKVYIGKTFPLHPPKFLMAFILVIDRIPGCEFPIRGHSFMTSTHRWTHVNGEEGQAPCGCPYRKLSCLLMQRSWYMFYQNFFFGRNKKGKFFGYIN